MTIRSLALAGMAAVLLGCSRYEMQTIACPEGGHGSVPSPAQRHWQATSRSGVIEGRVWRADEQQPLAAAAVDLVGLDRRAVTDSLGQFRLEQVLAGTWVVLIRRTGYGPLRDTVRLADGGGGVLGEASLSPFMMRINEACGFMRLRVRKPWWKVW